MKQLIALAIPIFLLFACGGSDSGTAKAGGGPEIDEMKGSKDGRITLTIDGQEYSTQGGVKNGGLHFKNKLFLGMSGDQPKMADGPTKQLWLTLQKNDFEPGTFSFLNRERTMRDEPDNPGAFVSLQFDGADSISKSVEGSITFEKLITEASETRTTIQMTKGSLEGTFRGSKGKMHQVSGTFEFYAN